MYKKLLCYTALFVTASTYASELEPTIKNQIELLKKAKTYQKKTLITPACNTYEKAYKMGYLGADQDMKNPRKNKEFVEAALQTSACYTNLNYC